MTGRWQRLSLVGLEPSRCENPETSPKSSKNRR